MVAIQTIIQHGWETKSSIVDITVLDHRPIN